MQNENQNVEKKTSRENKRLITVVFVIAVVIVLSGLMISKFGGTDNPGETKAVTAVEGETNNKSEISQHGSGFPLSFSSNDIVDIEAVGSNVYVVSNEMLFCISSSGKLLFSQVINYSEPVIKTNGNYGLVFDRLSGKYVVLSKKAVAYSGISLDSSQIITAAVSSDGSYAIASRSSEAASILTYYDKNGNEKFSWACTKDHIVSVAISSNGQNLACAALSASDGEIETKVYLLNIYSDETKFEYTVKNSAAIDIHFASLNRLLLLCNDKRLLISSKGEGSIVSEEKYASSLLDSYCDNDGYCVTLTSKFGSFGGYEIKNYSPDNSVNYAFETDESVTDILCVGKRSCILTETEVIFVNSFGKESKRLKFETAGLGMCFADGKVYCYSLGTLYKG